MSRDTMKISDLREKARIFRKDILSMITHAGSGHPGGSLSAVEILITLYYHVLNHRPHNPSWQFRDRFIMSKGHASPVLYTTLAHCSYFPLDELDTFRVFGSRLQGHIHTGVPGVELATGSLGQGLSVANGIALGAKIRNLDFRAYCLLGDGELQEGQVWEAAMTAAHHKLDNVCAIIDSNGVQENGRVTTIKNLEPLVDRWHNFGWHTIEVNGHNFEELINAFMLCKQTLNKPSVIIARTTKGKGVSFMEGQSTWHGKAPNQKELQHALTELGF